MSNFRRHPLISLTLAGMMISFASWSSAETYTEERLPCLNQTETKQPFFGDLHIHSRLSFDSYLSSQRNGPDEVYDYAKGMPITLPGADGEQRVIAQIDRPLDFAALTDHGEFLGQVSACQNPKRSWANCGQCAICHVRIICGFNSCPPAGGQALGAERRQAIAQWSLLVRRL